MRFFAALAVLAISSSCKSSPDSDNSAALEPTPSRQFVTLFEKQPKGSLVLSSGSLSARTAGQSVELLFNEAVVGSCALEKQHGRPIVATHGGTYVYVLCGQLGGDIVATRFAIIDSSLRHAGWATTSPVTTVDAIEGLEFDAPTEPRTDPAEQARAWLESLEGAKGRISEKTAFPLAIRSTGFKPACPSLADAAALDEGALACLTDALVPPGHRRWRPRREAITALVRLLEDQDGDLARFVSLGDGVQVDVDVIVFEERVSAIAYRVELVD